MVVKIETFSGQKPQRPLTERDLKSLRVFCAAAQAGGFAVAGQALNMSKASVSRHIREVEERLGVRLCERGPAGFKLTSAGVVALEVTTKALRALDGIKPDIDAVRGELTGVLSIGLVEHIVTDSACRLPEALNDLQRVAPSVEPELLVMTNAQSNQALRERRVQITMFNEYHKLYVAAHVSDEEARRLPLVHRAHPFIDQLMATGRYQQGPEASRLEAVAMFVATGNYVGLLMVHYADLINSRYPIRQLEDSPGFCNVICAITEASRPLPASAEIFLDILRARHASP
jgi:DNA-binding transcriptional LysR family regulator